MKALMYTGIAFMLYLLAELLEISEFELVGFVFNILGAVELVCNRMRIK